MKVKVYMRLARDRNARDGWRVEATLKANARSLRDAQGDDLHTIRWAQEIDVPDELLTPAKWPTVEVTITSDLAAQIPVEVEVLDGEVVGSVAS